MKNAATLTLTSTVLLTSIACGGLGTAPPTCTEDGEHWVPDLERCVCIEGACAEEPTPPEVGCNGEWKGPVSDNYGYSGGVVATLTPPSEPSLKDPEGGSCGTLRENFADGSWCTTYLKKCTLSEGKVVARAYAGWDSDCGNGQMELTCDGDAASYTRIEPAEDYVIKGTLTSASEVSH